MNSDFLRYFNIVRKPRSGERAVSKKRKNVPQPSLPTPSNGRHLLVFPLSASPFKLHDRVGSESPSSAAHAVRQYELRCTTPRPGRTRPKKGQSKALNALFLSKVKKRLRRSYHVATKKRPGPIIRVAALDFSRYSPFLRYSFSPRERRHRFRQLQFGLTAAARRLLRHTWPCEVRVTRLDDHVARAYRDLCRVRLPRLLGPRRPTLSLCRLTLDQVASAMVSPRTAFAHNSLRVCLPRVKANSIAGDESPPPCPNLRLSVLSFADMLARPSGLLPRFQLPLPPPAPLLDPEEITLFREADGSSLFDYESGENTSITSSATSAVPAPDSHRRLRAVECRRSTLRNFLRNNAYRQWAGETPAADKYFSSEPRVRLVRLPQAVFAASDARLRTRSGWKLYSAV